MKSGENGIDISFSSHDGNILPRAARGIGGLNPIDP